MIKPTTLIVGRPISLINTHTHQRFWLPNRDYWYEIILTKTLAVHRIVHNETLEVKQSFNFPLNHPRYEQITMYAQQLASKVYRRPERRDIEGNKKRETVFYNVVNVKNPTRKLMGEDVAFLNLAQSVKAALTIKHGGELFEIMEYIQED